MKAITVQIHPMECHKIRGFVNRVNTELKGVAAFSKYGEIIFIAAINKIGLGWAKLILTQVFDMEVEIDTVK